MGTNVTVQDSARPFARRSRSADPELYDFRRPLTLAREHARVLEVALERFARQWGTQMTARLRVLSQVTLEDLSLRTYDEYVRAVPHPTAMVLCGIEQTRQTAVLQMPVGAAMVWVDYLLGGNGLGKSQDEEDHEFTEIEWTLIQDLLQTALGDLGYAFTGVMPLSVAIRSVQYNPQFVQVMPGTDAVIVARFTVMTGQRPDTATLMFPAEALLGTLRDSDGGDSRSDEDRHAHTLALAELELAVRHAPVDVSVRFSPVTVQPRDVVDLAVGDVLPLSHLTSKPLDVVVDGVVLARAAAGNNGSRLACMVVTVEEKS
jgi:flagellar motor switch protein FliM